MHSSVLHLSHQRWHTLFLSVIKKIISLSLFSIWEVENSSTVTEVSLEVGYWNLCLKISTPSEMSTHLSKNACTIGWWMYKKTSTILDLDAYTGMACAVALSRQTTKILVFNSVNSSWMQSCHLGWRTLVLKNNKNNYDWLDAIKMILVKLRSFICWWVYMMCLLSCESSVQLTILCRLMV
jgi:hypothetical protein